MSSVPVNISNDIRKRIFIGLMAISVLLLGCVFVLAWWVVSRRGILVNKIVLTAITAAAIFFLILLGIGVFALVWSLWRTKTIGPLQNIMSTATNLLFPIALNVGKWIGLDEERIKNSFIQVSNQLVKTRVYGHQIKRVLILAPHCLQWKLCPHKITIDIANCRACGRCPVADLQKLAGEYQTELLVVTGGTFARKVIKDKRPEAIVAIACERDLTSGIQDIEGLPVIGIINERPEGPCSNTRVNLKKVEEAIKYFQQGGLH